MFSILLAALGTVPQLNVFTCIFVDIEIIYHFSETLPCDIKKHKSKKKKKHPKEFLKEPLFTIPLLLE